MQGLKTIRRNYETDFAYIEQFGKRNADGGFTATAIPENADFELTIWAEGSNKFSAFRKNGVYNYCEKIDASRLKVFVPLSKYNLGKGPLHRKLYIYFPDGFYQDSASQICIPAHTGIILYNGPSDDWEILPLSQEPFGGAFHGRDGNSTFYHIHTKKSNISHIQGSPVSPYNFYTVIEGATDDNLAEMSDPTKYRLVLLQERKHREEGRRWRIPMLPYEQTKHTGRQVNSEITETDTWWPITGRIVAWFRDGRKLNQAVALTISPTKNRFTTRNIKRRIGVALFKYTGAAGEGWTRISNIAYVELLVVNRDSDAPNIRITIIS